MANISKNKYIALRKKGENYMTSTVHDGLCHKLNSLKDIDKFYLKYYNKYTIYILKGFRAAKL